MSKPWLMSSRDCIALTDQLRFGNKAEVPFKQLSNAELSFLQVLYQKAGAAMQGHAAQLSTLQKAMNDDTVKFEEDDLEMLLPACARYLITNAIRGWLFQANVAGKPMAYLVTRTRLYAFGRRRNRTCYART
jgi:hypothetical protein